MFTKVPIPELAGNVADVRAGLFHTLILTKDKKLYALGRGRDGQLGNGKMVNGFALVPDMTDVVSFAAGTWHSVVARADGSVWTWGNDSKSQLCDGATTNRAVPAKVTLPAGVRVSQVAAGGHGTLMRTADGTLFGCGDNQFGPLGIAAAVAPLPTPIPLPAATSSVLALGGANAAISADGCDVHLVGSNDHGIVAAADTPAVKTFTARANLSLCGARSDNGRSTTIVNPAPRGGESNCWTTRLQEDGAASPRFAACGRPCSRPKSCSRRTPRSWLRRNLCDFGRPSPRVHQTMPARACTSRRCPSARSDGTRVWSTGCEVIPQIDRIGGAIAQISIFFNQDARGQFISPVGEAPKLTGTVAGYPEYDGWVLITKDKRLPWIPQTLADRLDEEGEKREKALAEAKRRPAGSGADSAAGGIQWLEKQVRDYQQYRASFTAEQLRAPAVWGDPAGEGRKAARSRGGRAAQPQRHRSAAGRCAWTREPQSRASGPGRNQEQEHRRSCAAAGAVERAGAQGARDPAGASRPHGTAHHRRDGDVRPDEPATRSSGPRDARQARPGVSRHVGAESDPGHRREVFVRPKTGRRALDWQTKTKESFDFAALAAMLP